MSGSVREAFENNIYTMLKDKVIEVLDYSKTQFTNQEILTSIRNAVNIEKEKEEVKTNPAFGSSMPPSFGVYPMHSNNAHQYNITIGAGDIENINDVLVCDNDGTYNKKKLNSLLNKVRDIDIFIPHNITYHAVGDYLLKNGYKELQTGKYYKSDIDDMNIYIDVKYTPSDYINGKLIMHAVDMTIGMSSYNDHGNLVVTTCKAFERSVTEKVICYNKLAIKYLTATLHRCYIDGKERFPQYDKSRLLNYIGLELNRSRDTDTKLDQSDPYFLNKRPSPGYHCKIGESSLSPTPHSPEYHNSLIYHRDS
jgi:hypothetical protein